MNPGAELPRPLIAGAGEVTVSSSVSAIEPSTSETISAGTGPCSSGTRTLARVRPAAAARPARQQVGVGFGHLQGGLGEPRIGVDPGGEQSGRLQRPSTAAASVSGTPSANRTSCQRAAPGRSSRAAWRVAASGGASSRSAATSSRDAVSRSSSAASSPSWSPARPPG
ncbi:hypothetical protein ACFQX6_02630 [Streptosporangium lutulentum]